jgi:DNA polymerase III gamma/tau subunit
MDTLKELSLAPAQLYIGRHNHTVETVEKLLQQMLCKNNGCHTCATCMQIREKQHHALMWLHPEKNYTIDQFEDVFSTLSFQLQPNEHFFFIIQKADFLTPACANKLLKPMEEPPTGYHFILLAERTEHILPTIISRCIVHTLETPTTSTSSHPVCESFTIKQPTNSEFAKIIDTANINERESIELLDQIVRYWLIKYQKNSDNNPNLFSLITKLQQAQLRPPMPGSTTIFWRDLYLQAKDTF